MNAFSDTAPPTKKRAAQKRETRARILEVARDHFERDGFEAANLRAIAGEAGVAAGTVLLHFHDKLDLLHAALFDDLAAVVEAVLGAPKRGRLETRLREIARAFFAYYAARPSLSRALLRESLFAASPWRERFTEQVARVHAHIARLVASAKAKGEVDASLDPIVLGASFFSFYYFALIGWAQGALADPMPLFERMLREHLRHAAPSGEKRTAR